MMGLEPASVRVFVRVFVRVSTLSNMNISETSWPIAIKFYLKHHWGGGKAALGFWPDRIRSLVSLATGGNEENLGITLAPSFLIGSSLFLQVTRTTIESGMSSKFDHIGPGLRS